MPVPCFPECSAGLCRSYTTTSTTSARERVSKQNRGSCVLLQRSVMMMTAALLLAASLSSSSAAAAVVLPSTAKTLSVRTQEVPRNDTNRAYGKQRTGDGGMEGWGMGREAGQAQGFKITENRFLRLVRGAA
ncbi:hypothetical protein C0Q70_15606 [Pomacea canaliculata]|uniref:Uncharacterized protein n=1 Tax=Pomacea canaliculata TaxID=400727 RepID=A0A2T7NVA3_POMCA|nr:hypothetical protein C0Q70_15606 [Pomacea canaliculata]